MTNRFAILCPGQGAQHAQMFDLAGESRRAELFAQWRLPELLGMPVDAALADANLMFSNRVAQPLIVAAQMAVWSALRNLVPQPALVAGYSIGELAAYGVAGALSADDAIALAATRARLMDDCANQAGSQAMLAVPALDTHRVRALIGGRELFFAIETGEDSVIVGGRSELVLALQQQVHQLGTRACLLPVAVASHTPLMGQAAARFTDALRQCALQDPKLPVLSGIGAQMIYRKDEAISSLSRQIAETIRWMDCMDACAEAGVTVALELGPGSALSRMMQARHPQIQCRSVAEFRSLSGIETWVAHHF